MSGAPSLVVAAVLASAFGLGLTGLRATQFQSTALNPALEGRDISVTGTVVAMPQRSEDATRFRLQVDSAWLDSKPAQLPQLLLLGWYSDFDAQEAKGAFRWR